MSSLTDLHEDTVRLVPRFQRIDTWSDEEEEGLRANTRNREEGQSSTSGSREGSTSVITLSDPGLLDCPICCEPLTVPVFQCDQNGHIACSLCCTKIKNKCPFCTCPIGSNRCRAIEKIVESSTIPCQNSKYGCSMPVAYHKRYEHEKACVYSPCSCPFVGCDFVSSTKELYRHCGNEHFDLVTGFNYDDNDDGYSFPITLQKNDWFRVLREKACGTLFIVYNRMEALGNVVTVSCVQPSFMNAFNYVLIVSNKESSLKFRSVTENNPSLQVDGLCPASFLLVPCEFFDSCGRVKIDVSIRRCHS